MLAAPLACGASAQDAGLTAKLKKAVDTWSKQQKAPIAEVNVRRINAVLVSIDLIYSPAPASYQSAAADLTDRMRALLKQMQAEGVKPASDEVGILMTATSKRTGETGAEVFRPHATAEYNWSKDGIQTRLK